MNYDQLNLQSPTLIDSSGSLMSDASGSFGFGLNGCVGSQCCDVTTSWDSSQARCVEKIEGFQNSLFIELVSPTSMPYTPYTVEKYKKK